MRFIAFVSDSNESVEFADIQIDAALARTLLTARKKLKELKGMPGLELEQLEELVLYVSPDKVRYFEEWQLGDEGLYSDTDLPGERKDLLTVEQRAELVNCQVCQISDDLKLHPNSIGEIYDYTTSDFMVVGEKWWTFRSFQDGHMLEMFDMSYDLLQRVL